MKAISLWQPWASLIACQAKRIETRSWSTPYRGPLAIHAAKRMTREEAEIILTEPFRSEIAKGGYRRGADLPLGAIVAVCTLRMCVATPRGEWIEYGVFNPLRLPPEEPERSFGDYSPGRFAWVLGDIKRLPEPIPYRGQRSLWDLEPEIVEHITALLAVATKGA